MTVAIIAAIAVIAIIVLVVACRRKAKKEAEGTTWMSEVVDSEFNDPAFPEEHVIHVEAAQKVEPKAEKPVSDLAKTALEKAIMEVSNEGKKTTEVLVDNAKEEVPVKTEVKVKKERKPRKTALERAEEAIAKLEGQISRRTDLLKKTKKPVTKDERLIKWKASLKDIKAIRAELKKTPKKVKTAPKVTQAKKAK